MMGKPGKGEIMIKTVLNALIKSQKIPFFVIPAEAVIQ